jgi:hypothetical protein
MLDREQALALRVAIVVLALAVLVCLALPMTHGDSVMTVGLMCCFVLVILLSIFVLDRPQRTFLLQLATGGASPSPRRVLATARAPDPITLGALLI